MRDLIAHQRHAAPDAVALINAETGERRRYAELHEAVERTAGRLWSLGLRPGDQLGVLADTSPAFARLIHAAWRIGAVLVPLHARLSESELREQCRQVDLTILVADDAHAETAAAVTDVPVRSFEDEAPLAGESVASIPEVDVEFDDPRFMLFTSGTTGESKAVVLTARSVLASAVASAFRLGVLPDDRWYDPLPASHMGGLAPVVRCALYGTTTVLADEFDAERALDHLREHDATGVSLVPTMLSRLLEAGTLPDSLRFVLVGGAPTPPELIERCEDRGVPIHPSYGMTETASQIATARPEEAFSHPNWAGRPLAFARVRAVENGEVLPPGKTGELVVRGPTVMKGYYGDPDATEAAFGPHGYHTGDLGVVEADGSVRVIGRIDDTIITGGENVHPAEVADALRDHPGIEDAAVVGLSDPEWGERVATLVVAEELTASDVRTFCEGRLANYKHPKTVGFADSLPRTASGTVDRESVRERLNSERVE